jgi:hypothetical protein
LRFVIDEQLRGHLRHAIRQYKSSGPYPFDAIWVGEPTDLPLGSPDPDILIWAENERQDLGLLRQENDGHPPATASADGPTFARRVSDSGRGSDRRHH